MRKNGHTRGEESNPNYLTSCWKTAKQGNSDGNKEYDPYPKMGHNATTIQCRAIRTQTELFPATLLMQREEYVIHYLNQYRCLIKKPV